MFVPYKSMTRSSACLKSEGPRGLGCLYLLFKTNPRQPVHLYHGVCLVEYVSEHAINADALT